MRRLTSCLTTVLLLVLAAVGCGDDSIDRSAAGDGSGLEGTVTVSAAASLRGAFTEVADDLRSEHPDLEVRFTFDASSSLAAQVLEGAPVDVFAAADQESMDVLVDEGRVSGSAVRAFARNELVIVTRPGNPDRIDALDDLARSVGSGVIALCGSDVPCGRYAAEALASADVDIAESSVTRGQNAGATLIAVAEGDAVAGIVYATDAMAAGGRVEAVPIAAEHAVVATYPIAVLDPAVVREPADAFVAHVLGARGQAILARHGFLPVP